jgi:hypothetical protein
MTDSTEKKEWGNKNLTPPTKIPETLYEAIFNMHLEGKKPKQIQVWLRDEHGINCHSKTVANHLNNIKKLRHEVAIEVLEEEIKEVGTDALSMLKRRGKFLEDKTNYIWTNLNNKNLKGKELCLRGAVDVEKLLMNNIDLQLRAAGLNTDDRVEVQDAKEKELLKKVEEISGVKINEFPEES